MSIHENKSRKILGKYTDHHSHNETRLDWTLRTARVRGSFPPSAGSAHTCLEQSTPPAMRLGELIPRISPYHTSTDAADSPSPKIAGHGYPNRRPATCLDLLLKRRRCARWKRCHAVRESFLSRCVQHIVALMLEGQIASSC